MAEMSIQQLLFQERVNTGTTWTRNEEFEKNGYFIIKNLCDPKDLYHPVPKERGQLSYHGSLDKVDHDPVEQQVRGSLSRYTHPQYKKLHSSVRRRIEKEIGRSLYETYYYDRFYFAKQELVAHADRPSCEISCTVHCSGNLEEEWPIWIKTPDTYSDKTKKEIIKKGDVHYAILEPGDGMVYKGCERPHWREEIPIPKKNWFNKKKEYYFHQIFFHYVLQDGERAHFAWDHGISL